MALTDLYSPMQIEVLRYAATHDFYMLINHGAKRSGKTVLDNDLFLMELRRVRQIADREHVPHPQYILAGADLSSIRRNVLIELENKYGIDVKMDLANRFELYGVKVCCFGHSKINDLGRIRGMTAYGAYVNEATIANREVFSEIKSRCSATGARLIMDTNPDRPGHWLKTDYIDKADGQVIQAYGWQLTDNTFLSQRYVDSIKASTPSGMFYDRDICGKWVNAQGIIYPDFDPSVHYITYADVPAIVKYYVGVDFGWEHWGACVLFGEGIDGNTYILKEWAAQHRSMTDWIAIFSRIAQKCNNPIFWCDSARPDLIDDMLRAGLWAQDARKDVVAGIAAVATKFKQRTLYVVREGVDKFDDEIGKYAWADNADAPIKTDDDVMDAVRYGIYSNDFYS